MTKEIIINGKKIQSFTTDLEVSWFDPNLFMGATMELNGQEFDILILKTDFKRLKEVFNGK